MRVSLLLLLLTCSASAQSPSRATTASLTTCINKWRTLLLKDGETFSTEKLSCGSLEAMYADSFFWYGSNYPNDTICELTRRSWLPEILAAQDDYRIDTLPATDGVTYKVIFGESGIFTAFKQHYVTWRQEENTFRIVAHSSLADDNWQKRKAEIAASTIHDRNGKSYYIINRDTSLFPSRIVYYLTDTLHFFEPGYIDACNGIDQLGFSTSGNVFVAIAKTTAPKKIISIAEITHELNEATYEEANIIRGGIPCYVPYDSISPDTAYAGTNWKVPLFDRKKSENGNVLLEFYTIYEYGDACLRSKTTVCLSRRGRKMKTTKMMMPQNPRPDHFPR